MSEILRLAEMLKKKSDVIPDVSGKINPVEKTTRAAHLLAELEEKHHFDRSEPSMEYKGSESNETYVREKILMKYGVIEADAYMPCVQVKPKTEWLKHGFVPIDGQEPLCYILTKRDGKMVNVAMWHIKQVEQA